MDWGNLPAGLPERIARHLPSAADIAKFRIVCKSFKTDIDEAAKALENTNQISTSAIPNHLKFFIVSGILPIQEDMKISTERDENKEQEINNMLRGATQYGNTAAVQRALAVGADVNLATKNGVTVLMQAAEKGHTGIVEALLNANANVNLATKKNRGTALIRAAEKGHTGTVKALLNAGAHVNLATKNGVTALMWAAYEGHTGIVEALLNAGANVNLATKKNRGTALMRAAEKGHTGIVKAFLSAGADVNLATKNGVTALMKATKKGHEEIVNILLDAGAKVNGNKMTEQQLADLRASTTDIIATLKDLFKKGNQ